MGRSRKILALTGMKKSNALLHGVNGNGAVETEVD